MRDRINLYSQNIKRLLTNEAASANMHVADQIVELGVGAILVGGFDLYGIQIIISATRLTGVCTDNVYNRPCYIDRSCRYLRIPRCCKKHKQGGRYN